MADLILPDHSFLESWMEAVPESGAHDVRCQRSAGRDASLVRHARHAGRAARHRPPAAAAARASMAVVRRNARGARSGRFPRPHRMWMHGPTHRARGCGRARFRRRWRVSRLAAANAPAVAQAFEEPRFDGEASEYPFHFLPYPSSTFFDGSLAHLPWLQEMPDPMTSAMWSSWIEINPSTAVKLGSVKVMSSRSRPHKGPYAAPWSSRRALRLTLSQCP